jgi:hypothetical protein
MKQTAVEWLAETLRFANKELYAEMYEHIEQAKEMEKEQIMDAWIEGGEYGYLSQESDRVLAEQYYNETFNITDK